MPHRKMVELSSRLSRFTQQLMNHWP